MTTRTILLVDETGQQWVLEVTTGALTIGSDKGNDVTLRDSSVSRRHARLLLEDGNFLLEDLGSTNGTRLNDSTLLRRERIRTGDRLQFGTVELTVMDHSSPWNSSNPTKEPRLRLDSEQHPERSPEKLSSDLLARLKSGDKEAANEVIGVFFNRVARAARRRLQQRRLRAGDSQDIAASVFESLWERIDLKKFNDDQLNSPDEFWRLLCKMVRFKTEDHVRRDHAAKRGGGEVRGESVFLGADNEHVAGLAEQADRGLTGPEIVALRDCHDRMMHRLEDQVLQEIVTLRMENYRVVEIAEHFGKSDRWVKRRLAEVREKWASLDDPGA